MNTEHFTTCIRAYFPKAPVSIVEEKPPGSPRFQKDSMFGTAQSAWFYRDDCHGLALANIRNYYKTKIVEIRVPTGGPGCKFLLSEKALLRQLRHMNRTGYNAY